MTGYKFMTRPSIRKVIVPTFRESLQRHARVVGGVDPISRWVGGYAGAGDGIRVSGGSATAPYGSLEGWWGCTANGHGVEWDLGLLETDRDWIINFYYFTNNVNGQVGVYMNDVLCGASVEQYTSTVQPGAAQRTWSPPASAARTNWRISLKVTGKHASSTGRFISMSGLVLSRTVGNGDRAL